MNIIDQLHYAKKINNYEKDATSGTLWTSTTTFVVVCPAGKRWFLLGGQITRDVSATVTGSIKDASDDVIHQLIEGAAATGTGAYPNQASSVNHQQVANPLIIDAGEYVELAFGVAQGGSAEASCVVLEVDY